LFETVKVICETGAELLYADEDCFRDFPGDLSCPHFKPGYGPDTIRGCNLTEAFLVCSKRLIKETKAEYYAKMTADERWDAVILMAREARRVERIPRVLFYRRVSGEGKPIVPAIRRVQDPILGEPLISILIPNKDHREDLARCVDSIRKKTTWLKWEIIIIENNSEEKETFRYYEELKKDKRIRVIQRKGTFNYSAVNNEGFRVAKGEQILLLNNDTEVISPDWIQEMLRFAQRKDVGAVGTKLYYPDGTIQHAGIGIGIKIVAGHYFRGFSGNSEGYFRRLQYAQNVSAVTAACMMIPRHVYEEMNGLDESFSVVFNDIDLCLRIREAGYFIVWTPWAELTHYESKSRGDDRETKAKERFFVRETNRFMRKWHQSLAAGDPYYNPNLTREKEDFSLR
jgi:GT2 family glycosyltransferase